MGLLHTAWCIWIYDQSSPFKPGSHCVCRSGVTIQPLLVQWVWQGVPKNLSTKASHIVKVRPDLQPPGVSWFVLRPWNFVGRTIYKHLANKRQNFLPSPYLASCYFIRSFLVIHNLFFYIWVVSMPTMIGKHHQLSVMICCLNVGSWQAAYDMCSCST